MTIEAVTAAKPLTLDEAPRADSPRRPVVVATQTLTDLQQSGIMDGLREAGIWTKPRPAGRRFNGGLWMSGEAES